MNTKRHLSLVLLGMIIVLPLLTTSCFKKGEEDPFFSMYTRKARIVGTWEITGLNSDIKRTYQNDVSTRTTTTVSGESWDQVIEILETDSVRELEGNVIIGRNIVVFEKNGGFKKIWEYQYTIEEPIGEDAGISYTQFRVAEEIQGTWNWLNNIDDYKNKERVAIIIEDHKTTTQRLSKIETEDSEITPSWTLDTTFTTSSKYANGEISTIWELDMLKKRSIKSRQTYDNYRVDIVNGQEMGGGAFMEVGYEIQTLTRKD